jgi:hypothetical protein
MTNEQKKQLKNALDTAVQLRDELVKQRMTIEKELVQQNRAIAALSEILGKSPDMDVGLTDATLLVIRAVSPAGLVPTEIRDELRKMGYDIDSFSNPMASLHQVLIRLEQQGQIEELPAVVSPDGKKRFRYTHPMSIAVAAWAEMEKKK